MTITNPNAYTSDTSNWVHSTFIVSLGDNFQSYLDIATYACQDELYSNTTTSAVIDPTMKSILSQIGDDLPTPSYYSKSKCRDTSLGGNDVINPYYQYNETDDVMHPFHAVNINANVGMGRVYSETIDDHQQVMYLSFGIPLFNNLGSFYGGVAQTGLSDLMQRGPEYVSAATVGRLLGTIVGTLVMFPVMSLMYLDHAFSPFASVKITKYYDFKSQQVMYYKFVNTILVNLAVNMGMMDNGRVLNNGATSTGSVTSSLSQQELLTLSNSSGAAIGVPDWIGSYQFDIFQIMTKKYIYEKGAAAIKSVSTDQASQDVAGKMLNSSDTPPDPLTWNELHFNSFSTSLGAALSESQLFIAFKVEKGVDTSESLSNTTGISDVQQQLNAKMQSVRSAKFDTMNGNIGGLAGLVGDVVGGVMGAATGVLSGLATSFGLGGLSALATGAGMVDIPEVWQDSSFNKSYSFKMQLRSPYGDPYSIIQSIYVPLACVLAGCLPRAIGPASYVSPFLVRAYCKGMFAVPLGIIDSVQINRGGDIHGWNMSRLPTAIDLSFTIKDLSPAMYMAMGESTGLYDTIVGENSSFQEYLGTLSGLGVQERLQGKLANARKFSILIRSLFVNKLNPLQLGMTLGSKPSMRMIAAVVANTKLNTAITSKLPS